MAAVIRDLVDDLLADEEQTRMRERADRLVGAFESDLQDVSGDHDRYLDEAFAS